MLNNGNFVKFSVFVFIISGLLLIWTNPQWIPEHQSPKTMGNIAFLYAFLITLPVFVFRMPDGLDEKSVTGRKKAMVNLQTAIAVSLFFDGAGGLGLFDLYKVGIPYDKFVHLTVSPIFIIALTYFILEWYKPTPTRALVIAVVVVLAGGVLWEVIEFSSDFFFGTKRFGIRGQHLFVDTTLDLVMDVIGTIGAAFLVSKRNNGKK